MWLCYVSYDYLISFSPSFLRHLSLTELDNGHMRRKATFYLENCQWSECHLWGHLKLETLFLLILGEGDGCSLKYIQLRLPIYTNVHYIFLEILRVSTSAWPCLFFTSFSFHLLLFFPPHILCLISLLSL